MTTLTEAELDDYEDQFNRIEPVAMTLSEARALLAAARAHLREKQLQAVKNDNWQPIETAPKDGTEVLTYRAAGLMAVALWGGTCWIVTDGASLLHVTHWQPLPLPPSGEEGN